MKRLPVLLAAGAGLLLAVVTPLAASAHVTVAPNSAAAGSWTLLNVKVPNESATAVTNKVELSLPTDTPILNVSYVPVTGWTTKLVQETLPTPVKIGENTITEAVTKVVWTASPGFEISAGQLQVFPLSLGPIPDTGKLVMPAEQTYSDGTVVSWSETSETAEHPAPVLYVNDAPTGGHSQPAAASTTADTIARGLGIGGLVLGAIGAALGIAALRRSSAD